MPAPHVLFVKLSSLGDVVHHLPAVTELRAHRPEVRIAWAVEAGYADLVRLHPAVDEAIVLNLRKLRRHPLSAAEWRAFGSTRRALTSRAWDYVIDAQGLLKSALIARLARGVAFGFDSASARERLAARFYDVGIPVPRALHAVDRCRRLVAEVFGYAVEGEARYGLDAPAAAPPWAPGAPYAVLLHAASRAAKLWPEARWIALGQHLAERGWVCVFPGGSAAERAVAVRLAAAVPQGVAAPPMALAEVAALLGHAEAVAGLDTGLTHLAVALGRPTVGIFCATRPEATGLHGGAHAVNVGKPGSPPSVEAVIEALEGRLAPQ